MAIATRNGRGGYEYEFVDTPPDELVCKICHCPSREPRLSECCGHTFCKTCLEAAKQVTVDGEVKNACPLCREKNFKTFSNKRDERAIKSLRVFCNNKDKGCTWQGELNLIGSHLANSDGCPFEEVKCSNKCGLSMQRQLLSKHINTKCPRSQVTCQYCNITGERQFITERLHTEQCPKFPLPCPNKCGVGSVIRENMDLHIAECPLEMIQCEYHETGCKDGITRQDRVKHNKEKMEYHLSLLKTAYLDTKVKLADAEKRIKEVDIQLQQKIQVVEDMMFKYVLFQWHSTLEERVKSQCTETPVTLKVSEYSKKKGSRVVWCSDCFSWKLSLFDQYPQIKLQVISAGSDSGKGTHLSVELHLVKGGYKRDFIALENQIKDQLQVIIEAQRKFDVNFYATSGLFRRLQMQEEERERVQKRKRLEKEREELIAKQELWERISRAHLHVMILNQITDSEHHSVTTKVIDLNTEYFLTNKDCNELIDNIPCFVSNTVLYKSTATCRYLKDDNIYLSIKVAE